MDLTPRSYSEDEDQFSQTPIPDTSFVNYSMKDNDGATSSKTDDNAPIPDTSFVNYSMKDNDGATSSKTDDNGAIKSTPTSTPKGILEATVQRLKRGLPTSVEDEVENTLQFLVAKVANPILKREADFVVDISDDVIVIPDSDDDDDDFF